MNRDKLKKILSWIACIAIFAYLFRQVHPAEVLTALKIANTTQAFLYGLAYFAFVFIVDTLALKHFIQRFATPVSFREIVLVRGVSYLMMIVNYAAGQGVFAIYLKKTHGAKVSKTLSTLFLMSIFDVLLVFTSALLALSYSSTIFHGMDLQALAFKTVPLLYLGFFVWVIFWKNVHRKFISRWRRFKVVHWFLEHDLFLIFREATLKDYVILLLYRVPLLLVIIGAYNFALMAFHAYVDWLWIFLYNPIIMFLTALPITPAGLGTGQLLTIEFFKDVIQSPLFAQQTTPENILFTSSLLWNLINQFYKALFGLICFSKSSKEFLK